MQYFAFFKFARLYKTLNIFVKLESYVHFYFMYIHIDILETCTANICINSTLDSLYDTTLVQELLPIRYDQEIGARFETMRNDDYIQGIYFVKIQKLYIILFMLYTYWDFREKRCTYL